MPDNNRKVVAFTGGVGGAKLALGLSHRLSPLELSLVVNTADDFEHLGLSISPDIDTLLYTLAGINDPKQGWGLANESWQAMAALEQLGGETWFRLGDRDMATHLLRSERLREGDSLSEVTALLAQQLGIKHSILPMTDDPVRTRVKTASGELDFQHYFVREQCQPAITGFYFDGIEQAKPQPQLLPQLRDQSLQAIILCPSNPFLSVEPMLATPGIRAAMIKSSAPVVAVSPIVAGIAIKGPAAKMMQELSMPATALAVAEYYGDLLDGFVIDESDAGLADSIRALGIEVA
ncbi:2-phospho-L-lactate transferase, partial [Deltaproteobacteria bacterium]|nr:2-phospho-L-lactate transferase [Deltaproteobacteria bacterium]